MTSYQDATRAEEGFHVAEDYKWSEARVLNGHEGDQKSHSRFRLVIDAGVAYRWSYLPPSAYLLLLIGALILSTFINQASKASPPHSKFLGCLSSIDARIVFPWDADYVAASTAFNLRYNYHPAAIIYPTSAQQVGAAVKCAAAANVSIAPRSGGHSYNAFGLGGADNFLVVDLSSMHSLTLAPDKVTVTIDTGNRLGDIALELYNKGRRALPHGVCPSVGLGGHAAFGGFGLTSRQWGLMIDRMVAAKLVLANGSIVSVSSSSYPDIFWAIRGAAPSFGIATSYTFSTLPAPEITTYYYYRFNSNASSAASALLSMQSFGQSAHGNLGIELVMGSDKAWSIGGSYPGTPDALQTIIEPLMTTLPTPIQSVVREVGWIEYLTAASGNNGPLNTSSAPLKHDTFYAKSLIVPSSSPLTADAAHSFFEYLISSQTKLQWFSQTYVYGGEHSAVSRVLSNATAYGNRDGLLTFQLYASLASPNTAFPEEGFEFVDGMLSHLSGNRTDLKYYPNYSDDRLSGVEWQRGYYGDNYDRLLKIKREIDPDCVFCYPQAIGNSPA